MLEADLVARELLELAKDFLEPVFETSKEGWNGLVGDRVSQWRIRNLLRARQKTLDEIERLGLKPNMSNIPQKYAFDWFEEVSKQDDDDIQTLFARLLARAGSEEEGAADQRLISVLGELAPFDAKLFLRLYSPRPFEGKGGYSGEPGLVLYERGYPFEWLVSIFKSELGEAVAKSIENLNRNGCLNIVSRYQPKFGRPYNPPTDFKNIQWSNLVYEIGESVEQVVPTELGKALYRAVRS